MKKIVLAVAVFAISVIFGMGSFVASAQTVTPTTGTTMMPSPTTSVPGGAPKTGRN